MLIVEKRNSQIHDIIFQKRNLKQKNSKQTQKNKKKQEKNIKQ